ncbi:MAG: protein-methionine-sulfoxide reductase catalytic subunit MsrP [Gammaproteobacteria bacterium]
MKVKSSNDIGSSEIASEQNYLDRRKFIARAGLAGVGLTTAAGCMAEDGPEDFATIQNIKKSPLSTDETQNSFEDVTTYNNFYEFGTAKEDPSLYSSAFNPKPWSVTIAGEAENTGTFSLEDILKPHAIEERIYRLRCVEAWSMVVPWNGIPLGDLLKRFKPTSKAKYVAFETVVRPSEMPGQKRPILDWPYVEGLRIDEAMHPLTILATGVYGVELPNQNGAPLRLIVPWKYGFKSIKSIVKISFSETEPPTSWNIAAPGEYGFYANVNPEVDHPRWSQARERRIGSGLFADKQPTKLFNGYGEQVSSLYTDLDLARYF